MSGVDATYDDLARELERVAEAIVADGTAAERTALRAVADCWADRWADRWAGGWASAPCGASSRRAPEMERAREVATATGRVRVMAWIIAGRRATAKEIHRVSHGLGHVLRRHTPRHTPPRCHGCLGSGEPRRAEHREEPR